jgi:hypothetical protein
MCQTMGMDNRDFKTADPLGNLMRNEKSATSACSVPLLTTWLRNGP